LIKNNQVEESKGEDPNVVPLCGMDCPFGFIRLIFMDLNMPTMTGFVAATKILEHFRQVVRPKYRFVPDIKIVALTAYTDEDNH
jgi:CheY-like chemotaxis protein